MAHVIEESKSNRASCRTCKQKIEKGVLRFGEEISSAFSDTGTSLVWHHLACAAGRMPAKLREAMGAFSGEISNKAELESLMANAKPAKGGAGAKAAYPYAEKAPTGRSKCMQCDEPIEKDSLRIAVEREVETGAFSTTGAGYLHPACAIEHTDDGELFEKVKANSAGLSGEELGALEAQLSAPSE